MDKYVNFFLSNKYLPKIKVPTVNKEDVYLSLPYLGDVSHTIEKRLKDCLTKFYPQINFKFIHINSFKINSFFRFKDRLPTPLCSSVVYQFTCPSCQARYIGSTIRALKVRTDEHLGQSSRTGLPLHTPSHSAVREHSFNCNRRPTFNDFKIIDHCCKDSLRILESLYIKKLKPVINDSLSAYPLSIV